MISCAPCTGFSRVRSCNHSEDDPRNALVMRSTRFVKEFMPRVFLMENTRELITGKFRHYYEALVRSLQRLGYNVRGNVYSLDRFGLPQTRERAIILAVRRGLPIYTLTDLWHGYRVRPGATHVRYAIGNLPRLRAGQRSRDDALHVCPSFGDRRSLERLRIMPRDGGSWSDLIDHPNAGQLLIPAMKRRVACGDLTSHCDAYGRLWWERPAVTIKRECGHQGNGRYSHPEQNRLLSVREMATLQGFPTDYEFEADSMSALYSQIGDAVPPLISYQLAHAVSWILSRRKPKVRSLILPNTHLKQGDIHKVPKPRHGVSRRSDIDHM
jgi:DNA (cytosine-5)-methyltransferase 1